MAGFRGRSVNDRCWYRFFHTDTGKEVVFDLDYKEARELIKEMTKVQRAAEEHAKANGIIMDSALLLRKGIPLGFSNHPQILDRAAVEAAHDRDLRRYLPGGIKSETQFGAPTIINHGDKNGLGNLR